MLGIYAKQLNKAVVTIVSLTCDDVASRNSNVHLQRVFLDLAHILKRKRNAFTTYGIPLDDTNVSIRWNLIEELVSIREKKGVHLVAKITKRHVT